MPRKLGDVRMRDLIVLWGKAAGRCSHPECKRELVAEAQGGDDAAALGEAAHIVAAADEGPRGKALRVRRIHGYDNLILLCAHHQSLVDRQAKSHAVETLRGWKTEHEAWVAAVLAPKPAEVPWTAIVQDAEGRVDAGALEPALGAGNAIAEKVELVGEWSQRGWQEAARHDWRAVELALKQTPAERRRFAVFSLGRIPLAVHLGYVLGDRARAEVYHYDRDLGCWAWPSEPLANGRASDEGEISVRAEGEGEEANLVVSLSARGDRADLPRRAVEVEIAVAAPSVRWLRERRQLKELAGVYERALAAIRERRCRRIHLYYAGPAAGAVELGRAYNPRMNPAVEIYEYREGGRPRYESALVLNGG
jgi:hypothetical protein